MTRQNPVGADSLSSGNKQNLGAGISGGHDLRAFQKAISSRSLRQAHASGLATIADPAALCSG